MKRILYLSFIIFPFSFSGVAAQNDTVVIHNPKKVTIVTGDSLQKIVVTGKEGDDKFTYQNTIQLVDSNYVSTTHIGRDRWELIPSVKVGKTNDDATRCRLTSGSASPPPPRPTLARISRPSSHGKSSSLRYSGTITSIARSTTPCRWASASTGRTTA